MEEFDDSDVEEIQLFPNSGNVRSPSGRNNASPSSRSQSSETSANATSKNKKSGMFNNATWTKATKGLHRQSSDSFVGRPTKSVMQVSRGRSFESSEMSESSENITSLKRLLEHEASRNKTPMPESSENITSLKRLLDHEASPNKTLKRQKTLEDLKVGSKNSDGNVSFPSEFQDSTLIDKGDLVSKDKALVKQEKEDNEIRSGQANDWSGQGTGADAMPNTSDAIQSADKTPSNLDCPPIAIVSPLSDQNPLKSDSPDDDLDKLDAKIFADEDFDPSLIEDLPCSLDEMVINIFSDKHDTFQTLDGSSWTFPDFQNINIDEGQPTANVPSKTTATGNPPDQNDQNNMQPPKETSKSNQVLMKNETDGDCKSLSSDSETKSDQLPFQNTGPNKPLDIKRESPEEIDLTNTDSPPIKAEPALSGCPSQGQPFSEFLQRYSPSYTVPTERITPPRPDHILRKSGYDGLIQAGPPNRMIPDIERQLKTRNNRGSDLSPFPAIQSMLDNQNFNNMRLTPPHQRTSSQPFHSGQQTPSNFHPSMQQHRPSHPTSMMSRHPSPNQPSSMNFPGQQYRMQGPNSNFQYPMADAKTGHFPSYRNNAPTNLPHYPQNYRPHLMGNRPAANMQWNTSGQVGQPNMNPNMIPSSRYNMPASYNPRMHGLVSPQTMHSSNVSSKGYAPGHRGMPGQVPGQQVMPYHYPMVSSNQPNTMSFQRPSPERLTSPSLSPGRSVYPSRHQPSMEQALPPQFQGNIPQSMGHQGQGYSKPVGLTSPKPSNDFFSFPTDISTQGYSQGVFSDPTLPSIKEKLTSVIQLSKQSPSPKVKYMVTNFLQKVKHAKESRLSDAQRYSFIQETKKFIEDLSIIMKSSDNKSQPTNAYIQNERLLPNTTYTNYNTVAKETSMPNTTYANYNMPQNYSGNLTGSNNPQQLTGFSASENWTGVTNSAPLPQFPNQTGTSVQVTDPFSDEIQDSGAGTQLGSPNSMWNVGGNVGSLGNLVKMEPANPLEQFIL